MNEVIRKEIKKIGSMDAVAHKLCIRRTSLYNKLKGECPWKVSELLALAKLCGWTEEKFLSIIGWKGETK